MVCFQKQEKKLELGKVLEFKFKKVSNAPEEKYRPLIYKVSSEENWTGIEPKLAIVANVNDSKKLFYFVVVNSKVDGIVKLSETKLRPNVGDFIAVRLISKVDKKREKTYHKVITVSKLDPNKIDTSSLANFYVEVTGEIKLKYRSDGETREIDELNEEEIEDLSPDFAFMDDLYIPKFLLKKHDIQQNCRGTVKAINRSNRWEVIYLKMIN